MDIVETVAEIRAMTSRPVYSLEQAPNGFMANPVEVYYRLNPLELSIVTVSYSREVDSSGERATQISLMMNYDYPRPYPVTSINSLPDGRGSVGKTDAVPHGGLHVKTAEGDVFHWIENDTLLTLIVEDDVNVNPTALLATVHA